ncbi:hypothetical protein HDU84_009544 [Entophlyctis sp. JEL0112]|nr:hypothetical protein HDU84_009544 [Entophlyctis sp. JEL0112]
MFDFLFVFPNDYPSNPPKVTALTTGSVVKRVRFNPNIYANGKSLLSDKPYLNEPGFENSKDDTMIESYNRKIMHGLPLVPVLKESYSPLETIRVTICDRLEKYLNINQPPAHRSQYNTPPESLSETKSNSGGEIPKSTSGEVDDDGKNLSTESISNLLGTFCSCKERSPFEDLCKRLFLLYFDVYMSNIEKEVAKGVLDGTYFTRMRFEGAGNAMNGQFEYANLRGRLEVIYKSICAETESWIMY